MTISFENIQTQLNGLQEVVINVDTYLTMLSDVFETPADQRDVFIGLSVFWGSVVSSFTRSSMILLHGLFDANADRGIPKFIDRAMSFVNLSKDSSIMSVKQNYIEIRNYHKTELSQFSDLLGRIRVQRDKYWAHLDKNSFDQPKEFFAQFPIKFAELIGLLEFAKTILRKFYVCVFEIDSDMHLTGRHEIQSVITSIFENHDLRIELSKLDEQIQGMR